MDRKLFRALGDPCRIALLAFVAGARRPVTVSEAACCCPVDLSVVSRHLKVLRDAGVLEAEKRGKEMFYCVPYRELAQALRAMAEAIEHCCPAVKHPLKPTKENSK